MALPAADMRFLIFSLWALLIPASALAQTPPPVICTGLAGCGRANTNVLFTSTLPVLIGLLSNVAGGLAVIFVGIAGVQMVLAYGDESKVSTARWGVIYALLGLVLAIASQALVAFTVTENYGQNIPGDFVFGGLFPAVMRIMVTLFNVVFVITIMFSGYRMTLGGGKPDELKSSLQIIRWSIAGAVVVNAAHALVRGVLTINL